MNHVGTIPEHFQLDPAWPVGFAQAQHEPSPPIDLTGWVWAQILQLEKKILARARSEMMFLVILHYKMCRWPAQARV
jgi:hypothetical protein